MMWTASQALVLASGRFLLLGAIFDREEISTMVDETDVRGLATALHYFIMTEKMF